MARKLKAGMITPVPTETDPKPEQQAGGETAGQAEGEQQQAASEAPAEKKRRGRPRAAPPPSNVTDETIREHCQKAARFYGELQTARDGVNVAMGTYRAALKEAGKAGVPRQAVTWYLAARSRDPDEIDRETRERNRIAKVMALPLGTQLGLWDDGETVAGKVDQAKIAAEEAGEKQRDDAYLEGLDTGKAGKALINPFDEGTKAFDDFEKGWKEGQFSLVQGMGGTNGAALHS